MGSETNPFENIDDHKKLNTNSSYKKLIRNNSSKVWKLQDNTEIFPTNAFGTLEFQGADIYTTKAEVISLYLYIDIIIILNFIRI